MVLEIITRVRDEFRFSPREQRELFISSLIFGFILSFRKWGVVDFDVTSGFKNWIFSSILILLVMLASISMQKIFALNDGYRLHYSWWLQGILMGLLITFISVGYLPIIYPGTTFFEHVKRLRMGRYRHGINTKDLAVGSIAGVVTNVFLALMFGFIYLATENYWVMQFIKFNFLYAFFSMLPLPRFGGLKLHAGATPGIHIFFFGRPLYVFIFSSLIIYSLLIISAITIFGNFPLLILAMLVGLAVMFFFLKYINYPF
ncbi:hypothetical protein HQ533_02855 [Candidatus Woesearchaeota archaeon]|nr:hypothetical protein [Candidatus Woesearchaeota archaeon]